MPETGPSPDWREEFKKFNQSLPNPTAQASPPGEKTGSNERRKFPRFEVTKISCTLYRKGLTTFMGLSRVNLEGTAIDLSEGGVRIALGERLFLDTKVHVRMEISKFQDVLESDGAVRWCREVPKHEPPLFQAGIMFLNPPASLTKKITSIRIYYNTPRVSL